MNLMGLPYISVSFAPKRKRGIVEFSMKNSTIRAREFDNEQATLIILGTPIIGERIVYEEIWTQVTDKGLPPTFLKQVNGEFLFITLDKKSETLRISTDRYASVPFFYIGDNSSFFGSVFYKDICNRLKRDNQLKLNKHAIFEFLWLQRLVGTKTYDSISEFLLAATTLTYRSGTITTNQYWRPSFLKTSSSVRDTSQQLAGLLRQSAKRKESHGLYGYSI